MGGNVTRWHHASGGNRCLPRVPVDRAGRRPAASAFPDRPIRLIVSFPPGGSSDAMARIVQPGVEKLLGQPIVIENRAGAGGMIAIDAVAKARA